MNLAINNDVESLTISEQKTILNCKSYAFFHEKNRFMLAHVNNVNIIWCPINVEAAHNYLKKNNIQLTLEVF